VKKWKVLAKYDKACIIAPSYGVASPDQVDGVIKRAAAIVELYSLTPKIYDHILAPGNHTLFNQTDLMFANSDEVRLTQLVDALNNPECKAVWCFRGGYGAVRLLEGLYKQEAPIEVKPLIGFSDITILHTFLNYQWSWPTIHFGMPGALQDVMSKPEMIASLQAILFGERYQIQFNVMSINEAKVEHKQISGEITGGNTLNLERLFGTEFQPSLSNKILVLEEVGEEARWLDGFLHQLKLVEGFSQASAIVFGSILPDNKGELFAKVIQDFGNNVPILIFKLFDEDTIGHGAINKALPMGASATINYDAHHDSYHLLVESGAQPRIHEDL
jgi:muramoyltetrapeptide carboxypeptidase